MKREDYMLDQETLMAYGQRLTKIRKGLREKALELHRQDAIFLEVELQEVTVLAEKMNRGYFKGQKHLKDAYFRDFVEDTAPMSRRRSRKRKKMTPQEKIAMVHKVLVQKETRKDVAKEMRVSAAVVARVVSQFK